MNGFIPRIKQCRMCGKDFATSNTGPRFYCSQECYKNMIAQRKQIHREQQAERRKAAANNLGKNKSIENIVHEIVLYNKKHGTDITYGQWMAGIRAN